MGSDRGGAGKNGSGIGLSNVTQAEWTIGRLLEWTTRYFRERHIDSPRLDAEVLLADVLACRRIDLYASYDEIVGPPDRARFREFVRQRTLGRPVAYLIGRREFYSLDFEVDPSVLIPRPDTEFVVGEALERLSVDKPTRLLDVGTGSGAIAIAIAVHRPRAKLVAVDRSEQALSIARKNAERHGVAQRITFLRSDLFGGLTQGERFDVVASNPPYVRTCEMADLPPEVRCEPAFALEAGTDGLCVLRPLVEQAPHWLRPGGWLVAEFGIDHAESLLEISKAVGFYERADIVNDAARRPRVFCANTRAAQT